MTQQETRYVALLRGINLGGNRKVPMPELRSVFESQGFTDVSTCIQSGNVLFSAGGDASPPALSAALTERFGIGIDVIVRTSTQLHRIVAECPFPVEAPKLLHVTFVVSAPDPASVYLLDLGEFAPETAQVGRTEIYFYLPNGIGPTKLPCTSTDTSGFPARSGTGTRRRSCSSLSHRETATQLRRASLFPSAVDHVMATAPIMRAVVFTVLIAVPGDDDHDVADLLLGLQVAVRVDDLLERVGAVDDGCELPGLDQPP